MSPLEDTTADPTAAENKEMGTSLRLPPEVASEAAGTVTVVSEV